MDSNKVGRRGFLGALGLSAASFSIFSPKPLDKTAKVDIIDGESCGGGSLKADIGTSMSGADADGFCRVVIDIF